MQQSTCVSRQSGHSLVELLTGVVILGLMAVIAVPALSDARRASGLRTLTRKIGGMMLDCRARALFRHRAIGLVFEEPSPGSWRCFVAEDGDGDGINRADLRSGRDMIVSEIQHLTCGGASLGILATEPVPDPMGGGCLSGDLSDPIRAGRGDIITFTPRGTATPSSVYLTDNRARMRALRVIGITGRMRAMAWQSGWSEWKRSNW